MSGPPSADNTIYDSRDRGVASCPPSGDSSPPDPPIAAAPAQLKPTRSCAMSRVANLEALYAAIRRISLRDSLDELIEEVLDRAQELIGFEHCAFMLHDPDTGRLDVKRARGYGDRREEVLALTIERGQGLSGWAAEHRSALRVGDVREDERYLEGLAEARSNLVVPLVVGNELAGVINVESEQPDAFTEEHEKLLTVLGAQAALAILASRARNRLQSQIQRLDVLYRISRLASLQENLDETLQETLRITREIVPEGQVAILLRDDEGNLRVRAAEGYAEGVHELVIPPGEGVTGRCLEQEKPVLVQEVRNDPDYIEGVPEGRSEMAVPLHAEGQVIGVLDVEATRPEVFDEESVRTLSVIAQQMAVVINTVRLHAETRKLAVTDPLTQLHNRRYFLEKLQEHVARASRYGERLALLLLDCDRLKTINDRHGHHIGDRALEEIGDLLERSLRETDETARIGGDEFAALLLNSDADLTRQVTDRLQNDIRELHLTTEAGEAVRISASTGVAFFPADAEDPETLLRRADEALYQAKRRGPDALARYGDLDEPGPGVEAGAGRDLRNAG